MNLLIIDVQHILVPAFKIKEQTTRWKEREKRKEENKERIIGN